MPADFPDAALERTATRVKRLQSSHSALHEQFISAWNAVSFRYLTLVDEGDAFTISIKDLANLDSRKRYQQERHLFGFFSNGFSAFEACLYGLFAIGAVVLPAAFPMANAKDLQKVSPSSTLRAYQQAFAADPMTAAMGAVLNDPAYLEWKDVRNILTHRTAPGRIIYAALDSDVDLPPLWKINSIPLDENTVPKRRAHAARMLATVLTAAADFVEARIT